MDSQNEQWLLPPSLDELVPENHFVRIVSKTIDEPRIEDATFMRMKEDHMLNGQLESLKIYRTAWDASSGQ